MDKSAAERQAAYVYQHKILMSLERKVMNIHFEASEPRLVK